MNYTYIIYYTYIIIKPILKIKQNTRSIQINCLSNNKRIVLGFYQHKFEHLIISPLRPLFIR